MRRCCHPIVVVLLASVVAAAALFAGCGSSKEAVTAEATGAAETTQQPKSGPTEAVLEPVGEQPDASGAARYSLHPGREPVLRIGLEGLEPVSGPARYAVWMYGDRHDMVILGAFRPDKQGRISRSFETVESHVFVEEGSKTELLVTKVDDIEQVSEGISEDGDPWDPAIIGEPVLQGAFEGPFVGSSQSQ